MDTHEITQNLQRFAGDFSDAQNENSEMQDFWTALFECFGVKRRGFAIFQDFIPFPHGAKKRHGFIDMHWPGVLSVEQKSLGGDLEEAVYQLADYVDALPDIEKPAYKIVCDFQTFILHKEGSHPIDFKLENIADHVEDLRFIRSHAICEKNNAVAIRTKRTKSVSERRESANIHGTDLLVSLQKQLSLTGANKEDLDKLIMKMFYTLVCSDIGVFGNDPQ